MPTPRLRWVRWRQGREVRERLPHRREPRRRSGSDALHVYPWRGTGDRLLFERQDVVHWQRFSTRRPHGVALQGSAAALVPTALRVAQGHVAAPRGTTPETLSPAKFCPRLAAASIGLGWAELALVALPPATPGVRLHQPDGHACAFAWTTLERLQVETRTGRRRKRRFCQSRTHWQSCAHIPGGKRLTSRHRYWLPRVMSDETHTEEYSVGKPIVSFVIPVLNGEKDIARCVRSILALHCPHELCEIIVMDNGSTDRTAAVVEELGIPCHVVPKVHVSALRNRGVARSRGEYIAFVDADVELAPEWLRNGLATLQDHRVVASGCFPRVPYEATWVQRAWDVHQRGRYLSSTPWPVPWLPSMNLLVRRAAFLAVEGFNEYLQTAEDVDLCYRLGQQGTILCNPAMEAIHWGEARDLRMFWRKEVWRGIGNIRGAILHGLRRDELPSVGYPLYILGGGLCAFMSAGVDLLRGQCLLFPISLSLLGLPALLLALRTGRWAQQPALMPQLFLLYLLYGFARAYAVVKPWVGSHA
jgi:YD repeat-containing protein